jgi:DNA polymerase III delta prime subunit
MPAHSRYKIYIIDEVHMLSMAAFNALLKTLEEPPTTCPVYVSPPQRSKKSRLRYYPAASVMI